MNPWLPYLQIVDTIRTSCNVKIDTYYMHACRQSKFTDHKMYFVDVSLKCSSDKVYSKT